MMSRIHSPRDGLLVMVQDGTVKKALVGLAIEKALLDFGVPVLDHVSRKLEVEHHCYIFDCYDKPEVLHLVLKESYGNASKYIVDSIKRNLSEFSHQEPISRFLAGINTC